MNIQKLMLLAFALAICADLRAQETADDASVERGKTLYEQTCLACHQADGSGVPNLAPPVIEGTFVNGDKKKLIGIILNGLQGVEIKGEYYANPMPAFDYLSDGEIADVLTYVRSNFKNKGEPITEREVKEARKTK